MADESATKLVSTANQDDTSADEECTIHKIAERLRFFFSDANLRIDQFLRREILKESSDGFVSIDTLLKFNTIQQFSSDKGMVARAAKHKLCSTKVKLSDDGLSIARCVPFTESMMKNNVQVTLRISNLPVEGTGVNLVYKVTTRDDIRSLFEEYGNVALVRLLYHYKVKDRIEDNKCPLTGSRKSFARTANGRAFVEFETIQDLQNAADDLCIMNKRQMDIDGGGQKPKQVLKIGDNELRVETMQRWLDKKLDKRTNKTVVTEDGYNVRVEEKRSCEGKDQEGNYKKNRVKLQENVVTDTFTIDWKSGCVIALKGLPDDCDREKIIEAVMAFFDFNVKVWADYSRGLTNGHIRFEESNDNICKLATQLADGNIKIGGSTVQHAYVLVGKEEEEYYKDFIAFKNKQLHLRAEEKQRKKSRFK